MNPNSLLIVIEKPENPVLTGNRAPECAETWAAYCEFLKSSQLPNGAERVGDNVWLFPLSKGIDHPAKIVHLVAERGLKCNVSLGEMMQVPPK